MLLFLHIPIHLSFLYLLIVKVEKKTLFDCNLMLMNFQKGIEMAFDDQQRVNSRKKERTKEKNEREHRDREEAKKKKTYTHDIDSQEPNAIIIEMVKSF